jgi:ribonuclease D
VRTLRARYALACAMNSTVTIAAHGAITRSISREEMANLPVRRFEGDVCMVATPQDLERAMADIRHESIVGFDTETRPSFTRGEVYPPCLVQVATARTVYLFQLRAPVFFEVLAELLAQARIVKAGVAMANDLRPLKLLFPFIEKNILDLGIVARRCGLRQTGLRNLAGIFLGIRIPKGAPTSNWAAPQLSAAQITYAATDAWACREVFLRFRSLGLIPT